MLKQDIKKEIGRRIAKARNDAGLTLQQLTTRSRDLFAPGRISNWEQGRRTPGVDEAIQLSVMLGVSAAYLLCLSDDENIQVYKKIFQPAGFVPLLNADEVVAPENIADTSLPKGFEVIGKYKQIPIDHVTGEHLTEQAFAYQLTDDSMSPDIISKDLLIMEPKKQLTPGCYVLAYVKDSKEVVVRQYREKGLDKNKKRLFELVPSNCNWPVLSSKELDLRLIGCVVEQRKYF